jgi:hypothetical protein
MRALPIGWVLPHDQAERRRHVTIATSRATHADPAALVAACVIAACASWALENASPSMLLAAAAEEARETAQAVTTEPSLAEMLTQVSAGTWEPPADEDATGAGDAFTVGLLHRLLQGDDMVTALQAGAAWGAAAVAQLRSIPRPWEELADPFHQLGTLSLLAADAIERGPGQFPIFRLRASTAKDRSWTAPDASSGEGMTRDLTIPGWSAGNRELCSPRPRLTERPVTESNLSLYVPAQNIRLWIWPVWRSATRLCDRVPNGAFCIPDNCRARSSPVGRLRSAHAGPTVPACVLPLLTCGGWGMAADPAGSWWRRSVDEKVRHAVISRM